MSSPLSVFERVGDLIRNKTVLVAGSFLLVFGYLFMGDVFEHADFLTFLSESEKGLQANEGGDVEVTGTYSGYADYDDTCNCLPKISITVTSSSWVGDVWNEDWNMQIPYNLYGTVSGNNLFDQYGNRVGKVEGRQLVIDYYGDTQYLSR